MDWLRQSFKSGLHKLKACERCWQYCEILMFWSECNLKKSLGSVLLQCLLRSRFFTCSLCNLLFSHYASFSFPYYTSLSLFSFWNLGSTHCTHCLSETLTFRYGQMRGIWRESTSGPCNTIFRLMFFGAIRDPIFKLIFSRCPWHTFKVNVKALWRQNKH